MRARNVLLGAGVVAAAVTVAATFGSMSSSGPELAGPCNEPRLPGGASMGEVARTSAVVPGQPHPKPAPLAAFTRPREAFDALPPSDVLSVGSFPLRRSESRRVARTDAGVCLFAIPEPGDGICLLVFDDSLGCGGSSVAAPTALGASFSERGTHYSALVYGLAPNDVDAVVLNDNGHFYPADARANGFVITVPDTTTEPGKLLDRIEPAHTFSS